MSNVGGGTFRAITYRNTSSKSRKEDREYDEDAKYVLVNFKFLQKSGFNQREKALDYSFDVNCPSR